MTERVSPLNQSNIPSISLEQPKKSSLSRRREYRELSVIETHGIKVKDGQDGVSTDGQSPLNEMRF